MPKSRESIIMTVVGDSGVGKTAMMMVQIHNKFPEEYLPTPAFEHHAQEVTVDKVKYNIVFRDTAGQDHYDMMLPLNLINANCFLLCYSIEKSERSHENVILKWLPLLRHYKPETPIILVGTKIDLRQDPNTECYTYQEGLDLMTNIKARGYVECSSKRNTEVMNVIVQAVSAHLDSKSCSSEQIIQPRSNKSQAVQIVLVGDGFAGKHNLVKTYIDNEFPGTYTPIVFEHYVKELVVDDIHYTLTIWEVAGQEDYGRLRALTYPNTDCFLLCFGVENEHSYKRVKDNWIKELRHFVPTTPVVLVGTKIDLRTDSSSSCLTYQDGENMMKRIKADAYVECSAKAGVGIAEVFIAAIEAHNRSTVKSKSNASHRNCVLS